MILKNKIDINCDLGEGMENDEDLMRFISSANIACGFHAGDEYTIKRAIALCLKYKVKIGAHFSFDDKHNFGRSEMKLADDALYELVSMQLRLMNDTALAGGGKLVHVKPHGALYNMASRDSGMSAIISNAVKDFNDQLILFGLSGSHLISEGKRAGLAVANEVFADRTYQDDGQLTSRSQGNALIGNVRELKKQVIQQVRSGEVTSVSGIKIPVEVDTICIHGDGPHAVEFAEAVYFILVKEGIRVGN